MPFSLFKLRYSLNFTLYSRVTYARKEAYVIGKVFIKV